jgi:hypothetical protein
VEAAMNMPYFYVVKRESETRKIYFEVTNEGDGSGKWVGYLSPRCLIENRSLAEWYANDHHGDLVSYKLVEIETPVLPV